MQKRAEEQIMLLRKKLSEENRYMLMHHWFSLSVSLVLISFLKFSMSSNFFKTLVVALDAAALGKKSN